MQDETNSVLLQPSVSSRDTRSIGSIEISEQTIIRSSRLN